MEISKFYFLPIFCDHWSSLITTWGCMTAVLRRLQSQIGYSIEKNETNQLQWGFSDFLAKQNTTYFSPLVRNYVVLEFEYNVFCSKLANRLIKSSQYPAVALLKENLNQEVATALALSELLSHIYEHYLNIPREVERLKAEQEMYRTWLQSHGYCTFRNVQPPEANKTPAKPGFFAQKVRINTAWLNWPRLFTVRARRVLTTLVQIPRIQQFENFCWFVRYTDQYVNPVLSHISWLFYIPRFAMNIILLFKHLIPGPWVEEKERELAFLIRLETQLQRRWFELGNDTIWLTSGLLNCFVFTGVLSPIGMYVTIACFLFDVFWAGLRAFIEFRRLDNLEKQYASMSLNSDNPDELKEYQEYQEYLQQSKAFEQQRLLTSVMSTSALFIAMCFAIPALTNPVSLFIGALLVISITTITYLRVQHLEVLRPANKIRELNTPVYADFLKKEGLFKLPAEIDAESLLPIYLNDDTVVTLI